VHNEIELDKRQGRKRVMRRMDVKHDK